MRTSGQDTPPVRTSRSATALSADTESLRSSQWRPGCHQKPFGNKMKGLVIQRRPGIRYASGGSRGVANCDSDVGSGSDLLSPHSAGMIQKKCWLDAGVVSSAGSVVMATNASYPGRETQPAFQRRLSRGTADTSIIVKSLQAKCRLQGRDAGLIESASDQAQRSAMP